MRIQTVIDALLQEDPNAEIMVQWFTKEDVEAFRGEALSLNEWSMATQIFDKWSSDNDYLDIISCLEEARQRLTA